MSVLVFLFISCIDTLNQFPHSMCFTYREYFEQHLQFRSKFTASKLNRCFVCRDHTAKSQVMTQILSSSEAMQEAETTRPRKMEQDETIRGQTKPRY